MKDVLKNLQDDDKYYGEFGKKYLSNSDIGVLLRNPKEFRKTRPDNVNFAKGRLFHQLILEPEKAEKVNCIDVGSRNTKAYKEQSNGAVVLLKKEVDEIIALTKIMLGNIDFFELIREKDNEYEVPMVREINGVWWKGKADIVNSDCLIDLKTTSDINKFKWSAREYNYDSQAYIYQELFNKPLKFLVIDKLNMSLGLFEPTQDFIDRGELKVGRALEVYHKFFSEKASASVDNYYIKQELE